MQIAKQTPLFCFARSLFNVTVALAFWSLSGCATVEKVQGDDQPIPKNKGLAMLKINSSSGCLLFAANDIGRYINEPPTMMKRSVKLGSESNYVLLELDADKPYLITRYYEYACTDIYWYDMEPFPPMIGTKAGSITYVGDFTIHEPTKTTAKSTVRVELADNEDETLSEFKRSYPKLFAKYPYRKSLARFKVEDRNAYVDRAFRTATFEDLKRIQPPIPVKVKVEFQRDGKHYWKLDEELMFNVEKALGKSGLLAKNASSKTENTLVIVANNTGDTMAARRAGNDKGPTLGLVGRTVVDDYKFKCAYLVAKNTRREVNYVHAIHVALDPTKEQPKELRPTSMLDAFEKVVEDVVVNCLADFQASGVFQ